MHTLMLHLRKMEQREKVSGKEATGLAKALLRREVLARLLWASFILQQLP